MQLRRNSSGSLEHCGHEDRQRHDDANDTAVVRERGGNQVHADAHCDQPEADPSGLHPEGTHPSLQGSASQSAKLRTVPAQQMRLEQRGD